MGAASYQEKGTWTASVSHRWQYSDKHYVGDVEQVYREKEGSQVINDINVVDLSISYAVNKRFGLTFSLPFQFATRSQAVRNTTTVDGKPTSAPKYPSGYPAPDGKVNGVVIDRFETSAYGMGDVKLLGSFWVFDPETHKKQNLSVGLGVLAPTGEKDVKDSFEGFDAATGKFTYSRQNVDNSIQPGSGAWGIIFDMAAYRTLFENFNLFVAGTYISTPEGNAGVKSGASTSTTIWSVNDSYLARGGFAYTFLPSYGLTFILAGRLEGAPPDDLIGSSGGRRRPGYAAGIEPGISFAKNKWFASFSTPVALYRNRQGDVNGASGDAAFADFVTLFSVGRSF